MSFRRWLFGSALLFVFSAAHAGCAGASSGSEPSPAAAAGAAAPVAGQAGMAGAPACVPPSDCPDIDVGLVSTKACCTPVTTCGYEVPEPDPQTVMDFPQIPEFLAMLTAGDPNGRCAPSDFFLGPRPGLWEHRVEVEDGGPDILITPDCESYTLFAFILPGCCLPDSTCGLSTDESWPTLEVLSGGIDAPFNRPQCVPAEVLNQQFRDSGVFASLARTVASGTCNHAALAAALPDER